MAQTTKTPTEKAAFTERNALEALKLLADWSKWIILVQAGMITAIGLFMKPEALAVVSNPSRSFIGGTVVCFAISIIAAAWLLKSLPATAQRLPPESGITPPGGEPIPQPTRDIFHMGTWEGTKGVPIFWVTRVLTSGFIIGLISFVLFVISVLAEWK